MRSKVSLQVAIFLFCSTFVLGQTTPSPTNDDKKADRLPVAAAALGSIDVLTDTQGVNFRDYLPVVIHEVRRNWYSLMPASARAPLMKKGKVSIEFAILKDGKVDGVRYVDPTSGDPGLDHAAYTAVRVSGPFPPLPGEFTGDYLALRFHFYYNPAKGDIPESPASQSSPPSPSK
jgi:TonB family protein